MLNRNDPRAGSSDAMIVDDKILNALSDRWDAIEPLLNESPDPAFLLDARGIVLRATRPIAGLDPAELVGAPFAHLVGRDEQERAAIAVADALTPGVSHAIDLPFLGSRGGVAWALARFTPVRVGGAIAGILVTSIDVSERRREEERLRRAERLMTDTQGAAHLGTWEWDPREPYASWSRELYKIYGLDPTLHAPSYQDYLTRVHPDDRERVIRATEAVFRDFRPYSHDERVFHADGRLRYLHTWAEAVLDRDGKLEKLIGVCLDVTDAKRAELALAESEARFRAIFDRSALGICTLAADGRILEGNARLAETLGRERASLASLTLFDLLEPEAAEQGLLSLEALFADHDASRALETRLMRANGTPAPARLTMSSVHASADRPGFVVCFVEDLSEREEAASATKLAESRLERIRQLEAVSDWKSDLLSMASHELKNPLTPIKIQLHLLRDGKRGLLTEEQHHAVEIVSEQADRLSALVGDVLDSARAGQGTLKPRMAEVDLGGLARRVADSFREPAREWGVTFDVDVPSAITVTADSDRVQQVLFNLLSNAFKFTPTGGRVTLRVAGSPDSATVTIADSGPGLTPDQRARLFQPFAEVHEPSVAREKGTGLGLFIAKGIVEAHGGTIEVASEPGSGATFRVTLPRRASA